MKVWAISIGMAVGVISGFAWAKHRVNGPEQLIVGTWREKAWEYEKVNTPADRRRLKTEDTVSQAVKDQLGKHLMIHSAETWEFYPNGLLILEGPHDVKNIHWKIKGRGHILELKHRDQTVEHYNITELTRDHLILNFDSDIQVKGIAKLTFQK
ncbi:MAG TPA: hypothetical protein VIU12_22615 [Chryseolinea sp.]